MTGAATGGDGPTNRLAGETSPYLLQHAHNPVDWYPWGDEAFRRAEREDKPVLLSIGYSACHWCHVMERESFEDDATAKLMNDGFVCVKVDREERPDVDDAYMTATVAMTGSGGWPMTLFLTPDRRPFFAGTYFPPEGRFGRPGFPDLLRQITALWQRAGGRDELRRHADELVRYLQAHEPDDSTASVSRASIGAAVGALEAAFDEQWGGFDGAPKFPPCSSIELLLRHHLATGDDHALEMVRLTLDRMSSGGIYDHVAGGFARYSTDERWLVPHFEKMLYDNAQLARVYLYAFQVTSNADYRRVARETLDYVTREMQGPSGGYFTATDADSEGVEGKFFVWTREQVAEILSPSDAEIFNAYYDVTASGNWEGVNILNTPVPLAEVARDLGMPPGDLRASLETALGKMRAARSHRTPPLLDDKVLTSINGLMIGAMAEGYRVLKDHRYLDSAVRAADRIIAAHARPDGGLYRTSREGRARVDGFLDDYAYLADALIDLYEASGRVRYLTESLRLAERMEADFADEQHGGLRYVAGCHEPLFTRSHGTHDGATPSAWAVAARALARLSFHFDRTDLREQAEGTIRAFGREIDLRPQIFATALGVVELLLDGPIEIVVAGAPDAPDTEALWSDMAEVFLPHRIVAHSAATDRAPSPVELPLASDKDLVDGRAALYVCRRYECRAPVTSPDGVAGAVRRALCDIRREASEI